MALGHPDSTHRNSNLSSHRPSITRWGDLIDIPNERSESRRAYVIAAINPLGETSSTVYDAAGRSISAVNLRGFVSTTVYDPAGRAIAAIDPLGARTTTVFDAAGREVVVVNARGCRTTSMYDSAGR